MGRREQIVAAAAELLEAEGGEALTMRRLGEAVGVRAPSLYKHIAGKEELLAALQERALVDLAAALAPERGSLAGLARAYRSWARAHPALYELATRHPLARARLAEGVEAAAAAPIVEIVGGDEHRSRALWAVAHGLVDLELADRFPPGADVDAAWDAAVAAFGG